MSTLKSSAEDLTLNADGSGNDIIFQSNAVEKGSLTAEGVLTATSFAGDGSSLTGIAGRRNMILNGAMKISQRGTSFAAIGNGDYSLDRWQFTESSIGAYTITQDSSGPAGFANSLKIDCTTADASPASGEWLTFQYKIEGQDLQQLKKGTASAESVTLSFWVKCNKTGNIQVNLKDEDNNRQIGNTVTIDSADTWEQKSLTFAGDTTGALGDDNACSMFIEWWLDSGSSLSSGAVPTSWETKADTDRNAGGTLAFADSTSNYINITGVQLELGTVATDFEHRSYGEELALCQRYYEKSYAQATTPGTTTDNGRHAFFFNTVNNGYVGGFIKHIVTKRATPTITTYAPGDGTSGEGSFYEFGTSTTNTTLTTGQINDAGFTVYRTGTNCDVMALHYTSISEL
jgi:hypothetical protein